MSPRTVLVTGASSGIGEAAALRLAHRGDHLVLLARREEELQRVARACRARGAASARVVVADVADDDAVEAAVATALRHHAQLDGVLHCAGMVTYGRSEETSAEDFSQIVSVNLLGAANLARHVVPVMRRQRAGALVLVGSLLGQLAVPEMTPYVVSKWGCARWPASCTWRTSTCRASGSSTWHRAASTPRSTATRWTAPAPSTPRRRR